ncbi:MAG TPA: hypothetical protein VFC44_10080, partial [Candidatus Saccharimonadales bacterium]|nr:hypothetical protein [Candidatus Saccharimonadales bacterium]
MSCLAHLPARLLVLGLACLLGPSLYAQVRTPLPRHLSRQAAVQEALAHNPAIAAAREQVAEAKAGIALATALPDPMLVAEVD